jgi:hypothetical protein
MSFIVQPAPRIITAPKPNKPSISKFGNSPAAEARAILHVHGQYKSNQPKNKMSDKQFEIIFVAYYVYTNGSRKPHEF